MIPRPEHPNPQWERPNWRCLNGAWEFDFDFNKTAISNERYKDDFLPMQITVPFCPESKLSGIGYTDFIPAVCYRKVIKLTQLEIDGLVILHFGAVDFHSYIYINGILADEHIGGYSSFSVDITKFVKAGENVIFLIAEDDVKSGEQPIGKQCKQQKSYGCHYTRTTGIWQTVWLEFMPKAHIKSCKYYPDIINGILNVTGETAGSGELRFEAYYKGKAVGSQSIKTSGGFFSTHIKLSKLHLWEIGNGRLYDLKISFNDDTVKSYFGMREVSLDGLKFTINGKSVFLRTVLDQGYYPDGIYTAPTDEALKKDIELALSVGFHGARLHQKVFEKRFLYHCDKMGYIVWGEHANWGMDHTNAVAQGNFICEWTEILCRDFNSPALIGWCPFNETWNYRESCTDLRFIESVYRLTKLYDPTRPCIETSGNYHISKKEIHDVHDYEQDPIAFADNYAHIDNGLVNDQINRKEPNIQPYHKEPIYLSEYGGIKWAPQSIEGWGYGNAPTTQEEFINRYRALTESIINNPYIMGLCYTQLYDVEQEQNGLFLYDRTPKFDAATIEMLKEIMKKTAVIEKDGQSL